MAGGPFGGVVLDVAGGPFGGVVLDDVAGVVLLVG